MNQNTYQPELEKITARITSRSDIERRPGTGPVGDGDHPDQDPLYEVGGVEFDLNITENRKPEYAGLTKLIVGFRLYIGPGILTPEGEERRTELAERVDGLTTGINIGDVVQIMFSRSDFEENRKKFGDNWYGDRNLWRPECLLYAPHSYVLAPFDDVATPEVKDINVTPLSGPGAPIKLVEMSHSERRYSIGDDMILSVSGDRVSFRITREVSDQSGATTYSANFHVRVGLEYYSITPPNDQSQHLKGAKAKELAAGLTKEMKTRLAPVIGNPDIDFAKELIEKYINIK